MFYCSTHRIEGTLYEQGNTFGRIWSKEAQEAEFREESRHHLIQE